MLNRFCTDLDLDPIISLPGYPYSTSDLCIFLILNRDKNEQTRSFSCYSTHIFFHLTVQSETVLWLVKTIKSHSA